jgi:hypothetical protein
MQKDWEKDQDIVASRWNYRIIDFFFWMKLLFNMIGFVLLFEATDLHDLGEIKNLCHSGVIGCIFGCRK